VIRILIAPAPAKQSVEKASAVIAYGWELENRRTSEPKSAAVILIIAIAATGILLMRFRKRRLAKINIAFTNRITGLFAGWFPGFGILTHVGRKSGKVYRTPVNVFRASNGFIIALTYSSESECVKNALAAGSCELQTLGRKYQLVAPNVVLDTTRQRFPVPVRVILRLVGADEYMELSKPTT
jgi:deazaflavin-dependent oxidoreductase (nitroreductase family)